MPMRNVDRQSMKPRVNAGISNNSSFFIHFMYINNKINKNIYRERAWESQVVLKFCERVSGLKRKNKCS